jgi:ATPase family associated with various cellular activities (AAA)/Winged helix domain, variant
MNDQSFSTWQETNQQLLAHAIAELRYDIERSLGTDASLAEAPDARIAGSCAPSAPALDSLCAAFALSSFERKILLMCAGVEMDSRFAALCRSTGSGSASFGLALSAFADAHWSALSPSAPLRRWHLVELLPANTLCDSPLRIDERVLHFLAGVPAFDARLAAYVTPPHVPEELVASHRSTAERIADFWSEAQRGGVLPAVALLGADVEPQRSVAAHSAAMLGLRLHVLPAWRLPHDPAELDSLLWRWDREAALGSRALLLELGDTENSERAAADVIAHVIDTLRSPLIVSSGGPRRPTTRHAAQFNVGKPTAAEQAQLWRGALGRLAAQLDGEVRDLVRHFSLDPGAIRAAAQQVAPAAAADLAPAKLLRDACRMQARPRLARLAQQIEPTATWGDLVLPPKHKETLTQIAAQVRQRRKVYTEWGFESKCSRGLGISALFAGPSGTGKTMAAEVLANDLGLDLFCIDLSQVVSKYIGETEKNLSRIFEAAEDGVAVLMFDEADALFGKRTDVKDSHDRYANIEVSYLLQRMEAFRGLAILTTNRKNALDQAFLRRIRFVVEFPFPDAEERAQIWRKVFPKETPIEGLHVDRLARLHTTGGNIRNIALGAAFLAADGGVPVRMTHLLAAARQEFAKIEKPLLEAEVAGWT